MIGKLWRDERGHILSGTRPAVGDPRPPITAPTLRTDAWWVEPALVVLTLGAFIVYSTWAALQNAHYYAALAYQRQRQLSKTAEHFDAFLRLAPDAPERSAVLAVLRTIK